MVGVSPPRLNLTSSVRGATSRIFVSSQRLLKSILRMHACKDATHLIVFLIMRAYNLYIHFCTDSFLHKPSWHVSSVPPSFTSPFKDGRSETRTPVIHSQLICSKQALTSVKYRNCLVIKLVLSVSKGAQNRDDFYPRGDTRGFGIVSPLDRLDINDPWVPNKELGNPLKIMFGTPYEEVSFQSELVLAEIVTRLEAATSRFFWFKFPPRDKDFVGSIFAEGFRIFRNIRGRNTYLPWKIGKIHPNSKGSRIVWALE